MMDWSSLVLKVLEILLPVLALLLVALIGLGVAYLRKQTAKIDHEITRSSMDAALVEADKVARDAVLAVQQMLVDELKASHEDGKLTKEEAQRALETATMEFLRHISDGSLGVLEASLGPVEDWVAGLIEAKVAEQKKSGVVLKVEQLADPLSLRPAGPGS